MIKSKLKGKCINRYVYFYKDMWRTPSELEEFSCGLRAHTISERLREKKYTSMDALLNTPVVKVKKKIEENEADFILLYSLWDRTNNATRV